VEIGTGARKRKRAVSIETFKKKADKMELMSLKIERLQKKSNNLETENREMKESITKMEGVMNSFKD